MGLPELFMVLVITALMLVIVWPAARICRRAGFLPWLGILSVIPVANILLLWFVALARWPGTGSQHV